MSGNAAKAVGERAWKPLGHFFENKKMFLEAIEGRLQRMQTKSTEDTLVQLIERNSSLVGAGDASADSPGPGEAGEVNMVTIRTMMRAGMHYGHAVKRLHAKMGPYVAGTHNGIHIINLERTLPMLKQACLAVRDIASRNGRVVFVGAGEIAGRLSYECAMSCEQFYVNNRWLGGTITNREHVLGQRDLIPDLLVVLDYPNNRAAVKEAMDTNVPVVAICDTDCDPAPITYPVPANDDAYASIEFVARTLAQAALDGRRNRRANPFEAVVAAARDFIAKQQPERNRLYSPPIGSLHFKAGDAPSAE